MTSSPPPDALSRADVAARLNLDPESVTREVHRGQIPRPDGRWGGRPWWREGAIAEVERLRAARKALDNDVSRKDTK